LDTSRPAGAACCRLAGAQREALPVAVGRFSALNAHAS
jgi:hypothetical protein